MKTPLLALALLLGLSILPANLWAQAGEGGRLSFLSAQDKAHLLKVREQVLSSHPELKSEQESLTKEREFVKNKGAEASADDRKTMRENFMAHNEKMEAAMKTADPTVTPILDQVNARMKERFQNRAGADANP